MGEKIEKDSKTVKTKKSVQNAQQCTIQSWLNAENSR